MKVQALTGYHDRNGFDCGVEALNLWLRQTALQHQAKGISRTFVAAPSNAGDVQGYVSAGYGDIGEASILGFYALASAFVLADDLAPELAKRYPRQIPVTRLGRLAIRSDLQGQGLGRLLLADAVTRSRNAALSVGSAGIFVNAKNAAAAKFYAEYGFMVCKEQHLKLFLPMWRAMAVESHPNFTRPARQRWESIPADIRQRLLANVWCGQCRHEVTITNFSGTIKGGDLLLVGKCAECHGDVARVIDGS